MFTFYESFHMIQDPTSAGCYVGAEFVSLKGDDSKRIDLLDSNGADSNDSK